MMNMTQISLLISARRRLIIRGMNPRALMGNLMSL